MEAWNILNSTLYFNRPILSDEGEMINFYNDFHCACDINPIEHNGSILWIAEFGHWSLDDGMFYHILENDMYADTYEELIIKIATWLVEKYGEDDLDDYYDVDEEEPLMKENEDGNYSFNPKSKSGWRTEDIIRRIREYEKTE